MFYLTINNQKYSVEFAKNSLCGKINNTPFVLNYHQYNKNSFSLILDNKSFSSFLVQFNPKKKNLSLLLNGTLFNVNTENKKALLEKNFISNNMSVRKPEALESPMPGLVVEILVRKNQQVKKNDPLIILEAMKMENVLKSTSDAVIKAVLIQNGNHVEKDQPLILFK